MNSQKKRALREVRDLYAGNLFLAFRDLAEQFGDDPETQLRCTRELVKRVYPDSYTAVIDVADARGDITVATVSLSDVEDHLGRRLDEAERAALAVSWEGADFDEWMTADINGPCVVGDYIGQLAEKAQIRESTLEEWAAWDDREPVDA